MKPRITISMSEGGELELLVNETGRDLLVQQLQDLDTSHDHLHLFSWSNDGDILLSTKAYMPTDKLIHTAKILFRPDQWDREYFPHVMPDGA